MHLQLLARKAKSNDRLTHDGGYVDSECSALDDMLPTIDPSPSFAERYRSVEHPDHGETCRLSYEAIVSGNEVRLVARSKRFDMI